MSEKRYEIEGREVTLPVHVAEARVCFASYLVPMAAAREVVADDRIALVRVLPRRAMLSLGSIEYRQNDLGAYNELAIAFIVQTDPSKGRRGIGSYIHRLPVTTSFSCEAGRVIWGLPKTVDEIEIEERDALRSTRLCVDGEHALTFTVKMTGGWSIPELPQASLACIDGVIRRTPFRLSGTGAGFRIGGATVELGRGPVADELRSLGLPKRAVMSAGVRHLKSVFDAVEVL